jgi:hypothetical protein
VILVPVAVLGSLVYWVMASSLLSCLISCFVAWHSYMCWDPSELDLPALVSELVKCLYGLS